MTPRDWNEIEKMLENVADKETVQKILNATSNGGKQPVYSETIFCSYENNFNTHTFTGTGRLQIITLTVGNGSTAYISVDGSDYMSTQLSMSGIEVFFNESVSFRATDVSMNSDKMVYVVQLV